MSRTLRGPRARGGISIHIQLLDLSEATDEESLFTTPHPSKTPDQDILDTARTEFYDRKWQRFWLVAIDGQSAVKVAKR